jgi:hypothetical protein
VLRNVPHRIGQGLVIGVVVTLQVFSGRPDPTWTLSHGQEAELNRLLAAAPLASTPPELPSALGYRGFDLCITQSRGGASQKLWVGNGWIVGSGPPRQDRQRALERWLLDTGRRKLSRDLTAYVEEELR